MRGAEIGAGDAQPAVHDGAKWRPIRPAAQDDLLRGARTVQK